MERKKQSMWKTFALAFCLLLSLEAGGCVRQEKKNSEQHELEIKVVTEEAIPEELMSLIEKNKKTPFRLTFADQGKLFLAEGYGEQKTTGYSVEVDRLCETQETVYIHTGLLGPEKGEEKKEIATYPYVVVELEETEKNIRFE